MLLSACTVGGGAPITFTQVRLTGLHSAGEFDAMDIDQQSHRLFVADSTDSGVDVIDLASSPAKYTHTISLIASPNGLAYAPDLKRLYVGLVGGSLAIVDEHDQVIKQTPTGGPTADLIEYSPSTHEVYAGISKNQVARFDAVTGNLKNVIKLDTPGLEQPRYNPVDHLLYLTTDLGLYAIEPATGAVTNRVNLGNCAASGLAINTKTDQALVACRTWVQRINLHDTNDQQTFSEVEGGDIINYYPAEDRFLVGMPEAIPSGVAVLGGNPIRFIAIARTGGKGNSAALDEATKVVYSPDTRPATVGLVAFNLPSAQPGVTVDPMSVIELLGIVGVVALVVIVIGRGGDPNNRPEPLPKRRRSMLTRN
jgi:DNA-binding beta-propeller fold protein YncE